MRKDTKADPRVEFAKEMPAFGPDTVIYKGEESRAMLADLLDGPPAVGGEEEVTRRLSRGRPRVGGASGKGESPTIRVRVTPEQKEQIAELKNRRRYKHDSDIIREALVEYVARHYPSTPPETLTAVHADFIDAAAGPATILTLDTGIHVMVPGQLLQGTAAELSTGTRTRRPRLKEHH